MAKVPITELPIFVYECTSHSGRKARAFIGNLPMMFKGDTPTRARMAADQWRRDEIAKLEAQEARKIERAEEAARKREAV